jgi:hypothetical protein
MQFFRFLCVLCSIIPNLVKATPGGLRAGELSLSEVLWLRPPRHFNYKALSNQVENGVQLLINGFIPLDNMLEMQTL